MDHMARIPHPVDLRSSSLRVYLALTGVILGAVGVTGWVNPEAYPLAALVGDRLWMGVCGVQIFTGIVALICSLSRNSDRQLSGMLAVTLMACSLCILYLTLAALDSSLILLRSSLVWAWLAYTQTVLILSAHPRNSVLASQQQHAEDVRDES